MNRSARRQRGTVLIIVVVIVMLLSLIAYKFMLAMQTEHLAAAIGGDRLQARQSAHSACDLLAYLLNKSRAERDQLGGLADNPAFFAGDRTAIQGTISSVTKPISETDTESPFGLIAYALAQDSESPPMESMPRNSESATFDRQTLFPPTRYGAINESQKLHLSTVMRWEEEIPGAGIAALMTLPGMDEETAASLLDWLDEDDEPRPGGAESDFYATLARPITPRNGLPFELDELLFVKGITAFRLYGQETELSVFQSGISGGRDGGGENSPWKPNELPSLSSIDTSTTAFPWADLVTIYSSERNESYTGHPRIFVNGKDLAELHRQLAAQLSKQWADYIVLYRQFGPNLNSQENSPQAGDDPFTIDFDLPPQVAIESLLDLIGSSVSIPTEDEDKNPRVIESPIAVDAIAVRSDFVPLLDLLTTNPQNRIMGRININEASPEILATLPGLSRDTVEEIVNAREQAPAENLRIHPIWLVTAGIVDLQTVRRLLPYITCGGDVYRAQAWGRAEEHKAMFRFETVLDGSLKNCRPVYYRELDVPTNTIKILSTTEFTSLGITTPNRDVNDF